MIREGRGGALGDREIASYQDHVGCQDLRSIRGRLSVWFDLSILIRFPWLGQTCRLRWIGWSRCQYRASELWGKDSWGRWSWVNVFFWFWTLWKVIAYSLYLIHQDGRRKVCMLSEDDPVWMLDVKKDLYWWGEWLCFIKPMTSSYHTEADWLTQFWERWVITLGNVCEGCSRSQLILNNSLCSVRAKNIAGLPYIDMLNACQTEWMSRTWSEEYRQGGERGARSRYRQFFISNSLPIQFVERRMIIGKGVVPLIDCRRNLAKTRIV